jgi:hypothetical protein
MQYQDGHISTCGAIKNTRDIYIHSAYACASYSLFVIYLFVLFYSLLIVHLFCSLFDHLFCSFSSTLCLLVVQKKILILNRVQVFRSCSTPFYSLPGTRDTTEVPLVVPDLPSSSFRVNKHHTADSTNVVLV